MKTETLSIDLLTIDGNTQARVSIHEDTVEEYADIISEGGKVWPFEPLDVFTDGNRYLVADGFHRTLAAQKTGRASIPCRVHKGTAKDARIFGMTANDRHGLRMSRADKRHCVEWLLDNGGKMTQAEIADKAGVSLRTVKYVVAERKPEKVQIAPSDASKPKTKPQSGGSGAATEPPQKPILGTSDDLHAEETEPETAAAGEPLSPAAEGSQQANAKPADAAAPSTSASIVKDSTGRDVPERFRDANQLGIQLVSIGREIDKFRQKAKELAELPGGEWIRLQEIDEDIRDLKGHFQLARYYTACVHCAGGGCAKCQQIGWMPEYLKATVTV